MSFATLNVMSLAALSVMILLRKSCDMIACLTLTMPFGHLITASIASVITTRSVS